MAPTTLPPAPPPADAVSPERQTEIDANIQAQLEDWLWLDGLRNSGQLEAYRGEFVVTAGKTILAHHPHYGMVHAIAERIADERGIPHERLFYYGYPGPEPV